MDSYHVACTVFVTVVSFCTADHEYMVSESRSISVQLGFETKLECVMNIQPDKFEWRFYPLEEKDADNPKARISLNTPHFQPVPPSKYNSPQKKLSVLTLEAESRNIAGDYQCLAYYGAVVVASVPWRVTISSNISNFPPQTNTTVTVVQGNTVNWRCEPPRANPEPYIDYYKNDVWFKPPTVVPIKSLILPQVTPANSGRYTCKVGNVDSEVSVPAYFNLNVVAQSSKFEAPKFIIKPIEKYQVAKGQTVFLECVAIGNPPPETVWRKERGDIVQKRSEMSDGGLVIKNVERSDAGVYKCTKKNSQGSIYQLISLEYTEAPSINCLFNTTDVTQGETLDLECDVTGTPQPEITWFLKGDVVTKDGNITTEGNKIYFRPAEKRHAGNLQIFARNPLGTVYRSISIKVIPLSSTQESSVDPPVVTTKVTHKKNNSRKSKKNGKMVPPSRPIVSRVSDEAVLVRWNVQSKGLPIEFFKVQYKELGSASQHDQNGRKSRKEKWMTTNADINKHIRSYEVGNLKPDHYYRFRIAAVYSNNDNQNSPNSEKFFLKKSDFNNRNPLPVPIITNAESINSTTVQIYWKCDSLPNITVDGYVINYNSASSAADYMKATVDGAETNSYVLSHLQPDTVYDIKLQSFSSKSASEYSHIHKAKTSSLGSTTVEPAPISPANAEGAGISKLYIFIAAGVLGGCGVIFAAVVIFMVYRKNSNSGVDDRQFQSEGNEYVVGPKSPQRTNGCVPSNRMTITANPLADADNKNQNMIEMSCLSSQNNNCSTVQPSVSGEDSPTNSRDKNNKNREKRIRDKRNVDTTTAGENFV